MLRDEFPRSSYTLITKVGKYGSEVGEHQYDPATIRASVERSLKRLGTDYLDVVCESTSLPANDLCVIRISPWHRSST